jgi:hypothetical protein
MADSRHCGQLHGGRTFFDVSEIRIDVEKIRKLLFSTRILYDLDRFVPWKRDECAVR